MMSIDEAIAKYKEIANTDANCPAHCNISCDKCVQESKQLAEWLEELKKRRNEDYGYLADIHQNIGYRKAIDDFAERLKEMANNSSTKYIRLSEKETITTYGVEQIAEQLKAGGENDNLRR